MGDLSEVTVAFEKGLDWWARQALGQGVPWFAALGLTTILSVISSILIAHTIGLDVIMARIEVPAKGLGVNAWKSLMVVYLGRPLFALVGLLLFVVLLRATLKFVGPTVSLRDTLAVSMHAAVSREVVRLIITSGLAIVSYLTGSRPGTGSEMEVTAASLLDNKANPLLHHFAMRIDIPTIVFLTLLVVGFERVGDGLSFERGISVVLLSWLSYIVLGRFWYLPG